MQSIQRAFRDYCGFAPHKNSDVDNIIFGQACRNVIVHSGGTIDKKLIKQISNATLNTFNLKMDEYQKVQFYPNHLKKLGDSMQYYLSILINGIQNNETKE
jgi:predicted nucleotidyltransferase